LFYVNGCKAADDGNFEEPCMLQNVFGAMLWHSKTVLNSSWLHNCGQENGQEIKQWLRTSNGTTSWRRSMIWMGVLATGPMLTNFQARMLCFQLKKFTIACPCFENFIVRCLGQTEHFTGNHKCWWLLPACQLPLIHWRSTDAYGHCEHHCSFSCLWSPSMSPSG
jgi:hypothetical protein